MVIPFRVKGPTLWNQLPEHIKKREDYTTFEEHLKPFISKNKKKKSISLNQCQMLSAVDKIYCFASVLYKFAFIIIIV